MSLDLNRVRQLFSQPEKLKTADFIYREIATRMAERLELIKLDPIHVLDAGCGRGADLPNLRLHYPDAHIVGLDASQEYLQQALAQQTGASKTLQQHFASWLFSRKNSHANSHWVNADFSQLPLPDQAVDLLWSNLALHWHPEPDKVFQEWKRALKLNGLLMFSCFGPDTLKEIRQAFTHADQAPHTLSFIDMHDLGDMLIHAGFATPVMDMEVITLTYSGVEQFLSEVRALGGNPLQTRRKGLMGKKSWSRVCEKLEQLRQPDGRIPLTLEIVYGHAFKPAPKSQDPGISVIKFDKLKK